MARRARRKAADAGGDPPADWAEALKRFDAHLEELERSRHTRANYREDLEAFEVWYRLTFKESPALAMIASTELRGWKEELRVNRKLEVATVNRKVSAIRSLMRMGRGRRLVSGGRRCRRRSAR